MTDFLKKIFICWFFVCAALCFTGCSEQEKKAAPEFLIKTPSITLTIGEFSEELDLKRAAYPYNINNNPAEYNEMVIHLVKMLSQEIVLLSAAADKGVTVTDQEVQSAEDEFKKDYPDDSFDQLLLKNAVSYLFWKKRFKKNMIMDKLIDQDLKQKIEITSQDIVGFYQKHSIVDIQNSDENALVSNQIEDEKELVSLLRMQKTQDHYDEWIQALEKDYPVKIDEDKLKTLLIDIEKSEENKNEKDNE
ncbi:hypothetical protein [Desulfobacula phenolica]|uniref:SurA N-terminal domain-containing protein n=1 Tax=Desulfobacula phenolica TaxID=90732 RepID=A0A1H2EUK6_9BACT|nr:hypothetical protein [Desulfobacula phenolica]SDT98741.1 hypothetical protein SAMN04487931_103362 [Desulfobacula phenolica]